MLMENFRRAIGLKVRETKDVYEGEVTELTPEEAENPLGGYGKTISTLLIGLKSARGQKKLRLDPSIYEAIQKERVTVGDVIYIEANTGACKRVGRSDAYATEFDLEAEEYVPIPQGRGPQEEGDCAGRDAARPRRRQCAAAGRPGHHVHDGPADEAQDDRDHGQVEGLRSTRWSASTSTKA